MRMRMHSISVVFSVFIIAFHVNEIYCRVYLDSSKNNHHNDNNNDDKASDSYNRTFIDDQDGRQRSFRQRHRFTIDELLNAKFPNLISGDFDLDICKAGKVTLFFYIFT